jgi:hypothetical protein
MTNRTSQPAEPASNLRNPEVKNEPACLVAFERVSLAAEGIRQHTGNQQGYWRRKEPHSI